MAISSVSGSTPAPLLFTDKGRCGCDDKRALNTSQTGTSKTENHNNQETVAGRPDNSSNPSQKLSEDDQQKVRELAARDREVKAHEAAHKAAGAGLTGPASFSYATGPDGKRYAIGGEVSVDTSPVSGDPQATLLKAYRIRAAALAPAEPSSQDQKVAAQAAQMAAAALRELAAQHHADTPAKDNKPSKPHSLYQQTSAVPDIGRKGNQVDYTV
jgi:hypothetical protein